MEKYDNKKNDKGQKNSKKKGHRKKKIEKEISPILLNVSQSTNSVLKNM